MEQLYKGYVVDASLIESDPHLSQGCVACHQGDESAQDRAKAHVGLVKRPSDDPTLCGLCHSDIAENYSRSLHFTNAGMRNGIGQRLSASDAKSFDTKVFSQSCGSCHATCYDCHLGAGATSVPGLILGNNPRKAGQVTTLRHVPNVRDTFASAGIAQGNFDSLPNYWDAVPHNTKKRSDRTRDCAVCHNEKTHFLKESDLPPGGSEANKKLIFKFDK